MAGMRSSNLIGTHERAAADLHYKDLLDMLQPSLELVDGSSVWQVWLLHTGESAVKIHKHLATCVELVLCTTCRADSFHEF